MTCNKFTNSRFFAAISSIALTLVVAACGGGDAPSPSIGNSTTTISGTVATGAPVVGTPVVATCQSQQKFTSQPTDSLGAYTLTIPTVAFPCIASVTLPNGETFRSFANGGSTANVTPLTELVVRRAGANPANFQQGTQETLQLLNTMRVPFIGDPTTTPFAPNGTGNDAAILRLFPPSPALIPLANGMSTNAFGGRLSEYDRIDPSTYPAVMPLINDPLIDSIHLGIAESVNEVFFGVGGYFNDKLDSTNALLVNKTIKYALGVMFAELAKKSMAKCHTAGCDRKIVLAFAKHLKDGATKPTTNYLKDILSNPLELVASNVFDSIMDVLETHLFDNLTEDGTFSLNDNVSFVAAMYGGRVAGHYAINHFIGGKIFPLAALLEAEFEVGYHYAKQDAVNIYYIAKMKYETAKENRLTENLFQIYLVRKNFRLESASIYSAWLASDRSTDVMATLEAKASIAKIEVQQMSELLPRDQKIAQVVLANSLIDKIITSYQNEVNKVLGENQKPISRIILNASSIVEGQTVIFDPASSSDNDGVIVSYLWNFGDGQTLKSSSNTSISHVYSAPGTYLVELAVTDNRGGVGTSTKSVVVMPIPSGFTVSGFVIDEKSNPVVGAIIALTSNSVTYKAISDSTGAYYLNLNDQQVVGLPNIFSVNAYEPINHNPSSKSFKYSDGRFVRHDFTLLTISGNPQVLSVELVPEVHHLGDSSYGGMENSQFQYPIAEGIEFSKGFYISSIQKSYKTATLKLSAKGVQEANEIWVNSKLIARLGNSDSSGLYSNYEILFDPSILILGGGNVFVMRAIKNGGVDYDDFEFSIVQIWFQ